MEADVASSILDLFTPLVEAITTVTTTLHEEVLAAQAFSRELQAMADRVEELAGDVAGLGSRVAQLETRPPLRAV